MRVVYDHIIFSLQQCGGISVMWRELIRRAQQDPDISLTVVAAPGTKRRWLERYRMPKIEVDSPVVFHSSYLRVCTQSGVRNITTIHDLIYHHARRGLARWIHLWQERRALRHSDRIVCVSETTRQELLRFYPHLDERKVKVVYNGVSRVFRPLEQVERKDYLLYVGNTKAAYKHYDLARAVAAQTGLELVVPKGVSEEQLNRYYNEALCLLYPSDYEGFGLPIVEAQAAGCPVVAQHTSCIPEVGGEAVLYIAHDTPEQMIRQMVSHVEALRANRVDRENLLRKGIINAGRFSWDRTYEQMKQIYSEC